MKAAFNNTNIITKERKTLINCASCCFFNRHDVCFNNELRHHNICYSWHILDINIDDIFTL